MRNPSRSVYIHIIGTRTQPTSKGPRQFHLNERVEESRLEATWTNPSESFVERSGGLSSTRFESNSAVVRGASIPALWDPMETADRAIDSRRERVGDDLQYPRTEVQGSYPASKPSSCFASSLLTVLYFDKTVPVSLSPKMTRFPQAEA